MSTMTTQPVRVGWGPRIEVLAGAAAIADGTVTALPHYGGLVPLVLGCFMGIASPVAFRQVNRFRGACAIVGGCLLFASVAGFALLSPYFLFYAPPLVVAAMAVFAADATARARQRGEPADQPAPISARVMLALVAISAGRSPAGGGFASLASWAGSACCWSACSADTGRFRCWPQASPR